MAGRTLPLRRLEQDAQLRATLEAAGVSPAMLERADRDGNGRVDAGEAFEVADGFDRDGNPGTLVALDAQWQPTSTPQPASSLSRFQRMLDETRGLLGP